MKQPIKNDEDSDGVPDLIEFCGHIKIDDQSFPLSFRVVIKDLIRLTITFENCDDDTFDALESQTGALDKFAPEMQLCGEESSGAKFQSTTISVLGLDRGHHGKSGQLNYREAAITIFKKAGTFCEQPYSRMSLMGIKCAQDLIVDTSLGRMVVLKNHTPKSPDDVLASISVMKTNKADDAAWFKKVDDFLDFMKVGLVLASGRRSKAPRYNQFEGNKLCITFYGVDCALLGRIVIPSHQQGDYIKALAKRFDAPPLPHINLGYILGWFYASPNLMPVELMAMMVCLEFICKSVPRLPLSSTTQKKKYKQPSLSIKLAALRNKYNIDQALLSDDVIMKLTKARNSIVHGEIVEEDNELLQHINEARELIVCVVLAELQYNGGYDSALHGCERTHTSTTDGAIAE